jgi:DNA-binding NarL/FixJ family response regulator
MLEFSKPMGLEQDHARLKGLAPASVRVDLAASLANPAVGAVTDRPRVLVTDDQALFRAGLARLMAADAQLRVVNPTDDGLDTVERTLQLTPDIVLMDVQVPGAAGAEKNGSSPAMSSFKVVVLAADFDLDTMRAMRNNGAVGDLGQDVIPEGVVSRILALYAAKDEGAPERRPEISRRELSVLSSVAAGQSNKQIGKLLGISQKTVRNHLSRIFHKLRAANRTEAVMKAMRLGLLTI